MNIFWSVFFFGLHFGLHPQKHRRSSAPLWADWYRPELGHWKSHLSSAILGKGVGTQPDPERGRLCRKDYPWWSPKNPKTHKNWVLRRIHGASILDPTFRGTFWSKWTCWVRKWNNFSLEDDLWQVITKSIKHIWKEESNKRLLNIFKCVVQAGITLLNMFAHILGIVWNSISVIYPSYAPPALNNVFLPRSSFAFPLQGNFFSFVEVFLSFTRQHVTSLSWEEKKTTHMEPTKNYLGVSTHLKNLRQNKSLPKFSGWKHNKYLKPPARK